MRTIRDEDAPDTVTIEDVTCTRQTAKAICVMIDGAEHWLPQSVVDDDSEVYEKGGEGKLVIAGWFARKEGLG